MIPRRCVRLGCPEDQAGGQTEQTYGLHLCDTHYQQFRNGTIGQDFDPRSKEWGAEELELIVIKYALDNGLEHASLRTLAAHLDTSKDTIHHLFVGTFPVVRSRPAMNIIDAHAQRLYEIRHGLEPCSTESPTQLETFEEDENENEIENEIHLRINEENRKHTA